MLKLQNFKHHYPRLKKLAVNAQNHLQILFKFKINYKMTIFVTKKLIVNTLIIN